MRKNVLITFAILIFFSPESAFGGEYCNAFLDNDYDYLTPVLCPNYCCGTCTSRYCCKEKGQRLNQLICSTCQSFQNIFGNQSAQTCASNEFCCGTCKNRFCCSESKLILDQTTCTNQDSSSLESTTNSTTTTLLEANANATTVISIPGIMALNYRLRFYWVLTLVFVISFTSVILMCCLMNIRSRRNIDGVILVKQPNLLGAYHIFQNLSTTDLTQSIRKSSPFIISGPPQQAINTEINPPSYNVTNLDKI